MTGRFEDNIRAYEAEPPPAADRVVAFYGSSSIHLWPHLERYFPGVDVRNRGFGGGTLEECVENFDRLVTPLHPRALVVYAGENDIAEFAATADSVLDRMLALTRLIGERLPGRPFAYISIKPSPARVEFLAEMRRANVLIQKALAALPNATFIDIAPMMLGADGAPRADLFSPDGYHMDEAGYLIWQAAVSRWLKRVATD
jgi:lysophospholipase L1-like esterase